MWPYRREGQMHFEYSYAAQQQRRACRLCSLSLQGSMNNVDDAHPTKRVLASAALTQAFQPPAPWGQGAPLGESGALSQSASNTGGYCFVIIQQTLKFHAVHVFSRLPATINSNLPIRPNRRHTDGLPTAYYAITPLYVHPRFWRHTA